MIVPGLGIEGVEHRQLRHFWKMLLDRIIERELALLDELHERRRGDRLGHRCDPEQCIGGQGAAGRDIGHSEGALIDDALAIGDERDDARHLLTLDGLAQLLIDQRAGAGAVLRLCDTVWEHEGHWKYDKGNHHPSAHERYSPCSLL